MEITYFLKYELHMYFIFAYIYIHDIDKILLWCLFCQNTFLRLNLRVTSTF